MGDRERKTSSVNLAITGKGGSDRGRGDGDCERSSVPGLHGDRGAPVYPSRSDETHPAPQPGDAWRTGGNR